MFILICGDFACAQNREAAASVLLLGSGYRFGLTL